MDDREHDFEFDFFPDRQTTPAAEEDDELLWEESRDDAPVRRAAAPTSPDVVMRRRVAAAAAVALLLLIIIIVIVTSGGGGGSGGSYRGYVNDVSPIASDSQGVGTSLAAVSGKGAAAKIDSLIQQTTDDVTRLQALNPPSTLQGVQSQALAALDLRLTGLQGIRNTIAQAQAGTTTTSWDAAISTQVDDLVTSDLIWSQAVRDQANGVLQSRGLGGIFPGSTFVGDRSALLKSLRTLLGAATGGGATGPNLSLGSKGADVVAWQNGLIQWLQKTGSSETLTADGTFGATTQTVTEQLQTAAGLSPDGVVGPSTRQALQQALAGTKTGSTSGTTTTPTTTGTARTLKLGDTGQDVVEWQTQLNQWLKQTAPSATQLVTDGSFGQSTQTATEQLQTQAGLTPTGQVDAATRQALQSAIASASPNRG